ncbi:staphopain proregion domain-containing protein, partial [Staphylococcus epidermidis]|uniref:staphopain proregion domain-containing protein n=1 Tax=Staphylococcus epidermidis TaxID=1282 RepID=UPI0028CB8DA2
MNKKLSYIITIILPFTLTLPLPLFFNTPHPHSLPQNNGPNQKTTKLTLTNKHLPHPLPKLPQQQYLSPVPLLHKPSNHKPTSYTL